MKKHHKKLILTSIISACAFASPQILAHSKFTTTSGTEGAKVYNNISVGHGCENTDKAIEQGKGKLPVIANRLVLPDGSAGTRILAKSAATSALNDTPVLVEGATVADYLTNWPSSLFSNVPSTDIFKDQSALLYTDPLGYADSHNVQIYTSAIGKTSLNGSIPGNYNTGLIPFVMTAPKIKTGATNCAKTVVIQGAIADICKFTNKNGLSIHTANIWMPANTGSKFDSLNGGAGLDGYGSPAEFTVSRDITATTTHTANTLDSSCGDGLTVYIVTSGAQLNRDLPIKGRWAH